MHIAVSHITMGEPMKTKAPVEIRISFSRHLKTAPLLTALNPDSVHVQARRGEAHEWVFELAYCMMTSTDEPDFTRSYRLEIF